MAARGGDDLIIIHLYIKLICPSTMNLHTQAEQADLWQGANNYYAKDRA